jgi:tetratricopeptide (TPR) repeat protein
MKFGELISGCTLAGFLFLFPVFLFRTCAFAQANAPGFDDVVGAATAARQRDDVAQAIGLYRQALQLKPEWPDGWWFLGSLQYEAEAYAAGRDALSHFLELVPDAAPAWALRGLCEFETGEYSQALADLQRGLSLGAGKQSSDEKVLRYHEALLLTRSGNFEAALRTYAPLAQGKVPNPEFLIGIGLAALRTPLLPRDLRADKQDLYTAAGHATFLFVSGDQTASQRGFQELFQRFPTAVNAHYLYGSLLYPTAPDQAISEFRRELEIAPSNAAAHLMMAWDSILRNDFSTALAYAEKAESEEPASPAAQLVLGRALVETGDLKHGIGLLEKEQQVEPDNFEIHLALARAYSKSGRKEDARRERLLCLQMEKSANNQEARR